MKRIIALFLFGVILFSQSGFLSYAQSLVPDNRPIAIVDLNAPISPATDDFVKTSLLKASEANAKLIIFRLNTPGGLVTSMQSIVEQLLDSKTPSVVYVSPAGGGAISAGVFITLAANYAVMAPGTTIGAAHPVLPMGQSLEGDMKEKVENFTVSLIKAISEQRNRNVQWAEKAVRESVSITDREALEQHVVDFTAQDVGELLAKLEGKTTTVKGQQVTLTGLVNAPQRNIEMSVKQKILNVLTDPNIALLLIIGAILGLGIEFYHPGALFPGIFGAICLVLGLSAFAVLPINYGGVVLILLAVSFFIAEVFVPSFGVLGISGIVCLVLGSLYLIDTDMVWSVEGFTVNKLLVGSIAATIGALLMGVAALAINAQRRKVVTGVSGLIGKMATVSVGFDEKLPKSGRVKVMGEIWNAKLEDDTASSVAVGDKVEVVAMGEGMTLVVRAKK